ncbi:putative phage cell wall peptidase, NlpC/P60 family [Epibacterium ulvae]|uniref:Putative phage cell wall peptidase, NlpC/P60 family n=1 Tax=Epibacterium ulvae TaxID=1156985 RepID=A0A1G5RCT8_9RHOB|nr:NlpC/P60 family protein [Epibacterium ulvae]SCZ71678.1 putative phage cell wall peptidase, NlpC/P60 family [Epibacterium ulvae]
MSRPENSASVLHAARRWLGTPYVHQSATLGAGCDCLGLVRGVWADLYGAAPETPPAYSMDWSEPQGDERLWQAASRHLRSKTLADADAGDVILFRMRAGAVAKHLGIQSHIGAAPRFIHAYQGHGVVESPLSQPWQRRIVARFAFPHLPTQSHQE